MASHKWRPRPPSRKGAPIKLHTFGDKDFERLCSEIFEEEPNIDGCDIYGVPGQGQFGIDLIAREADAAHVQVGQCKCRREFSTKDIKEVSDKFFEHWAERWSLRGITRFILFLACEVDETQKQDEIDRQREYFARFAIKYEVWPASRIIKKLRPYSGIVSSYFEPAEYWVERICGQSLDYPRSLTNAVVYQNEQLSAVLAGAIEATVVNIREAWQEGRREDARKLLLQAKGNEAALSALPNSLRAKLIRFEAIDLLERGGAIADAERIAERAAEFDSSGPGTVQLAAVLRLRYNDPAGALGLLGRETDLDSIHLRASILLSLQRTQEAEPLLAKIDDNTSTAETHRLRALIYLSSEDITSALLEAQKAVELQPRWPNVVFLAASIEYLTSLAFPPRFLPNIPEPAPWDLVKRDDATLQRLAHAASLFRSLLEGPDLNPVERETLEIWQLACLANHPGHQDDAAALCDSIIKHQPTRAEPVAWAIVRNMDVNLDRAEAALRDEINSGGASGDQIVSLVAIHCHHKQWHKAERLLDQHRGTLLAEGGEALFTHWKAQVLSFNNQLGAAIALIDSSPAREELLSLRAKVVAAHPGTDGLHRDALTEFGSLYNKTGNIRYLLDACVIAERAQDWQFISDHAQTILNSVETAEIVRPVASATFNAGRPDLCLQLLDASTRLFPGEKLPSDLRRLRIACQQGIGAIPAAVLEAERLVHDEPTLPHLLGLSEVYFSKGDFRRLCIIGRALLRCPGLTADSALRLSWQTQWEDPHLSRDLWHHAVAAGLSDSAVMPALRLGYALGLDEELAPLTKRMEELGRAGQAGIQLGTIEQLIEHTRRFQQHVAELNDLYTSAQIPIHMVADQVNLSLAEIYHANIERCASSDDLSEQSALLTRYGGKAIAENAHSAVDKWRLNLDVTALLVAADLELLSAVESKYRPIRVSRHLIPGLVAMRDHLTANQPQRLAAARQIVALRDAGKLAIANPKTGPANDSSILPPTLRGEWEGLLNAADACSGFVVEFIPIPSSGDFIAISSLPQEIQRRVVNCRSVIEALRTHGPFSDEEYHSTLRRLGSESGAPTFTLPKPEDHLFFRWDHGGTAFRIGGVTVCVRDVQMPHNRRGECTTRWRITGGGESTTGERVGNNSH